MESLQKKETKAVPDPVLAFTIKAAVRKCRTCRRVAWPRRRRGRPRRRRTPPPPPTHPASVGTPRPLAPGQPKHNLEGTKRTFTSCRGLDRRVRMARATDLHIPGKATAARVASGAGLAPSVGTPRVCSVCSAACTLASSMAALSLLGVNGSLRADERL